MSPLIYLTGVVVLGIAAQWIAWRLRLPAILLLLAFGFLMGQLIEPEELSSFLHHELLFPIVSLSVAVILFEGGLSLRFRDVRETSPAVIRLVTIGAAVTWVLASLGALLVFDHPQLAILAGAVFVVTGPTVIGPLLRHVRPTRRVGSVARWEGIVIDPVGALLALLAFNAALAGNAQSAAAMVVMGVVKTIAVSIVLGFAAAGLLIALLRRHSIPDYLENPIALAIVVAAFTASNLIQEESGLATVTLVGMILANQRSASIEHLIEFKENLGVLLISGLFILLSSRIQPADLASVGVRGPLLLGFLIVVVRPVAVMLATLGTALDWRERLFLSWLAPRGIVAAAVASVFALEIVEAGGGNEAFIQDARQLVPLTFLVIVGTVAVYGLTAAPLARLLKIAEPDPQGILFAGADRMNRAIAAAVAEEGFVVELVDTNRQHVRDTRMQGLRARMGSILSEYFVEELDLGGIGRLLAMTPNDEVNALAALEFSKDFGRGEVFQLPTHAAEENRNDAAGTSVPTARRRGRILFDSRATYSYLASRHANGAVIKTTSITEEFGYEDFVERHGESAIVLFVVGPNQKLQIATADEPPEPKPGQKLIYLADPQPNGN